MRRELINWRPASLVTVRQQPKNLATSYTYAWITAAIPAQAIKLRAFHLATPRTIQLQRTDRALTRSLLSGLPY